MLKVNNIKTYYGNIQALKGISLEIEEGEIVTLIGANGAGKTTTLMSLCGIVPPRSGEILFQGKQISGLSDVLESCHATPDELRQRLQDSLPPA